jgi:hypothetical protein
MDQARTGRQALAVARGAWALGCVLAPARVGAVLGLDPGDRPALVVLRVLGARELAQTGLVAAAESADVTEVGVWVDSAHVLSMAGLAAGSVRYRRAAVTDGLITAGWAWLGRRAVRGAPAGAGRVAGTTLHPVPPAAAPR